MAIGSAQKTPVARYLEQYTSRKIAAAMELLGQNLPASVVSVESPGTVKVKFELANIPFTLPHVTVPVLGSEFIRLPIQPGMLGWVISASTYLGGVSGLGGGVADLTPRPNLSNVVWSPIGNTNWSIPDDTDSVVIYGPDGVILRTLNGERKVSVTGSGVSVSVQTGDVVGIGAGGTLRALLNELAATVFDSHTHNGGPVPDQQMGATEKTTILKAE